MKTETKEIYKCDHCNKLYQRKHACILHEKYCSRNPDIERACFNGCAHLHKQVVDYYSDTGYGEIHEELNLLHCKHKNIYLYPPKSEAKKNWFELGGEDINEPMPKECNDFKEEFESHDFNF